MRTINGSTVLLVRHRREIHHGRRLLYRSARREYIILALDKVVITPVDPLVRPVRVFLPE
jgi:hypothetical protein